MRNAEEKEEESIPEARAEKRLLALFLPSFMSSRLLAYSVNSQAESFPLYCVFALDSAFNPQTP